MIRPQASDGTGGSGTKLSSGAISSKASGSNPSPASRAQDACGAMMRLKPVNSAYQPNSASVDPVLQGVSATPAMVRP